MKKSSQKVRNFKEITDGYWIYKNGPDSFVLPLYAKMLYRILLLTGVPLLIVMALMKFKYISSSTATILLLGLIPLTLILLVFKSTGKTLFWYNLSAAEQKAILKEPFIQKSKFIRYILMTIMLIALAASLYYIKVM